MAWSGGKPLSVASVPAPTISNVEAECALLGGLMIENRLIDRAADIITVEDFADPFLGRVYAAIRRQHDLGQDANPVTVKPYFEDDPVFADIGGTGFLAQLTGSGAVAIGALDFARQVAELATRRRFAGQMEFLARTATDYDVEIEQLAADAEAAVSEAVKADKGTGLAAWQCMELALAQMVEDKPQGVTTGGLIPSLDYILGPIRPGHLVILAGRPAMGKTATAISYGHGVGRQGEGVLVASLEMRADELGGRLAADVAFEMGHSVPYAVITDGGATVEQRRNVARAALAVKAMPIWIEDLPSATIGRLAAIVRRQARRFAAQGQTLRLVIVDYLQLLRPNHREPSLYEAITAVSRGLKALAKAEGVGVLALCQLSREVEKRSDKRPILPDLKGSGDIEQDADTICFLLRREEYMNREQPDQESPAWTEWRAALEQVRGKMEFIVAKRRGGRTGTAHGLWHGEFQAVRG